MAIPQGFAKHRGRGGGRGVWLRRKRDVLVSVWQPQTSSIYRGKGGCAPLRVSTPKRRRPALDPIKGDGQGEERGGAPLYGP